MKITCQSCQSKYTVSDEKVQGKTVKIKCRKCGATILVNSGGVTTSAPADPVSASAGGQAEGGASYLVNVADGDQRSMTIVEIVAAYQTGAVNADTYVWADGMGDWQPLGQVDAIVAAMHAQPAAPAAAPSAPMAAVAAEPEHRAAARREAARPAADLFGAKADDVAVPAPAYSNGSAAAAARAVPAPQPSAPRGAAEENSMLFSLSALTAKAGTSSAAPPKHTTARDREDSGIIDLKALAAAAAQPSPAPGASSAAALFPDGGLFPLGAPPVGAPAVAPPVVAQSMPPPKSKTPLFLGIGGVVAIGAIVGAFLIMKGSPPPPPAPAAVESAAPTASAAAEPSATPSATPSADPSATPSADPSATPASSAIAKAGKGGKGAPAGKGGAAAPAPAGKGGAAAPAPAPAPAGPKKGNCGCAPGDLMCAMKCSAGK